MIYLILMIAVIFHLGIMAIKRITKITVQTSARTVIRFRSSLLAVIGSVGAEYAFLGWRLTGLHRETSDSAPLRPRPYFFRDSFPHHTGQGTDSGCLFQDTGAGFGSLNIMLLQGH